MKKASASRSKAFDRKLVAVYSRGTLVDDDIIGVSDGGAADGGGDTFRYIVSLFEQPSQVCCVVPCSWTVLLCCTGLTGVLRVRPA